MMGFAELPQNESVIGLRTNDFFGLQRDAEILTHFGGRIMDRITLAAIWGGSLIVSLGVGFLLGFSLGGSVERMGAQAGPAAVRSKRLTRGEFERLVVGRTRAQIMQVLGRPNRTSDIGGGGWTYENLTTDVVSGRLDRHASIYFEGGVAERVLWH